MVRLTQLLFASATIAVASALPLGHQKRIAQTIADSTTQWVAACQKAGGADKCGTVSQNAFQTLLAAGKNCDQQDAADAMVDLAKQLNNDPDMIRLAQIFVQQPRNAPDSLQVPYCQTAPKNEELNGLFHCQFSGSDFTKFSGDQTGNTPLGQSAPNPAGSCPAKTDGPVPDGQQLTDLVQSPGTPDGAAGAATGTGADTDASATDTDASATDTDASATDTDVSATDTDASATDTDVSATDTDASATDTAATSASTVAADGADTGATGAGATGSSAATASGAAHGADASAIGSAAAPASTSAAAAGIDNAASGADSKSFTLDNGKQAQQLNAKFATLTADSACQDGEQACVGSSFAQCVGGKFTTTACAGGTQCAALPLVNSPGTSVTCSTADQTAQRIAATGATGGVTGSG